MIHPVLSSHCFHVYLTCMQELMSYDKSPADGSIKARALYGVQYVPLTTREKQESGARGSSWADVF